MRKFRPIGLAVLSAVLLSLGWPEIGGLTPLLFVAFVPLLFLEEERHRVVDAGGRSRLMLWSYSCFLLWNLITTWWIYFASAGGMAMAVVFNSLFMTIIFQAFHRTKCLLGRRPGYAGLVIYWIAWEYIHMTWELTWPWLSLGNGLANNVTWVQWYEYTGILGGSAWILTVNILVFNLLRLWREQPNRVTLVVRSAIILLVVALPIGWSSYRYHHYTEIENPVNVVVIQPNIDPYRDKFDGLPPEKQVSRILELAEQKVDAETDYLVGPETALPSSLWEDHLEQFPVFRQLVDYRARYPRLNVVIGMSSVIGYDHPATATARKFKRREGWYDHYNTAMHLDSSDNVALYHKSKLVPGVERMPYPAVFKPLQEMAIDLGGTSGSLGTQKEREVFFSARNNMGVAPVICYESIFGDYVGEYLRNGAELIFIITNDGWWEDTPGYRQHLAYARLRAIEGRRSIARSANTGISCFINQRGDVQQATSWWEPDVIKATINANDTLTFYTRHGDYLARIALWFGGLLMLWATVRKFVRQRKS